MLTATLQLKLSPDQKSQTKALLIPGQCAQSWLNEIASWPIEHSQLKLIVVPESKQDLTPRGALVFGSHLEDTTEFRSLNVIEFTCRADQLFLPTNGQLYPQVNDEQLQKTLPTDSYCVWHPSGGLTTVSNAEVLTLTDLIRCGSREVMAFDAATPGIALNSRMHSLTRLQPPKLSVEDMLSEGKDDIGGDATDLSKLKPISDESKLRGGANALDSLLRPVAHLAKALTSMVPRRGNQQTWVNGVENWANNLLNKMSEKMQQRQFLDVYRLQEMLEKNPDEGLKFAMPLSNMVSSGLASTTSWLTQSLVNFNLFNLGSGSGVGGPALPADLHSQLMRRYRELAEREIRLGRYRRAAYIYGNLLFDFSSAAKTLETGKHFREAAILYREKLHRSEDAARCLKEGGFFSEAIELFESLKQFESAGDLYSEIGLEDDARDSWRTAADQKRNSGDLVDAARVEEVKLGDDDLALETLASAWPASHQSTLCLAQTFRILAAKGQHQRSRTWIAQIESEAASTHSFTKVVELISKTATNYPDQSTRTFAVDATYRMVSAAIANETRQNSRLLKAVSQLHPSDKLLRRDCTRFKPARKPVSKIAPTKIRRNLKELTLVAEHILSNQCTWENATGLRGGFLVLGRSGSSIHLHRLSADFQTRSEHVSNSSDSGIGLTLMATNSARQLAIVHGVFDTRFPGHLFASDSFPNGTKVRQINLESNIVGICEGPHSQWQMLRKFDGQLLLECMDKMGALTSSRAIDGTYEDDNLGQHVLPPIYCDGLHTYVAISGSLVQIGAQGEQAFGVGERIEAIAGSVRGVATRIAVTLKDGFRVLWLDGNFEMTQRICENMPSPKILFTRTGHLIAISGNRCEVFHTRRKEMKLVGKISVPKCRSLFRVDDSAQFGMLDENGRLMIYQIPI